MDLVATTDDTPDLCPYCGEEDCEESCTAAILARGAEEDEGSLGP